jgi:hypothetical protein
VARGDPDGGLNALHKERYNLDMPTRKNAQKAISLFKTKTLRLVTRLVLGGLVDWENPDEGHNALHKGS